MDGWKSTAVAGIGVSSASVAGTMMHPSLGDWIFLLLLAVLACVPQLTELYKEFNIHREDRWVLDDEGRTNRDIARRTGVPLPPPDRTQPPPVAPAPRPGLPRRVMLRWLQRRGDP
jgi:hypothetical protein